MAQNVDSPDRDAFIAVVVERLSAHGSAARRWVEAWSGRLRGRERVWG